MVVVAVKLVMESRLDRGNFLAVSRKITNKNHALGVDTGPKRDILLQDTMILDDFAGRPIADALINVGFLIAGPRDEIDLIVESCSSMPYLTADIDHYLSKAVIVTGSLFQWSRLAGRYCRKDQPAYLRKAFSEIVKILTARGFHELFGEYKRQEVQDGTILLLPSR